LNGNAFDEERCEDKAVAKYSAANAKLTGCPPCVLNDAPIVGLGVRTLFDAASGSNYCASPSGAFVNRVE